MSHTPGPWGWTYDGSGTYSVGRADDPQVLPIANVHSRDFIGATGNCNLIAAAPDLLAECKALRVEVQSHNDDYHHVTSKERLASVDAAIAKAEGL